VQDACLGCFFTLFFYVLAPWSARPVPVYTPACSGGNAQSRAVPAEDLDALLEQALALHAVMIQSMSQTTMLRLRWDNISSSTSRFQQQ